MFGSIYSFSSLLAYSVIYIIMSKMTWIWRTMGCHFTLVPNRVLYWRGPIRALQTLFALWAEGAMLTCSVRNFKLEFCYRCIQLKPLQKDPGAWKAWEGDWPSVYNLQSCGRPKTRQQTLGLHLNLGKSSWLRVQSLLPVKYYLGPFSYVVKTRRSLRIWEPGTMSPQISWGSFSSFVEC